ncbi:hypothetical protein SeKB_A1034 [Salmonella enterica subsp. enterica serovar Kentucky str. CDC 191]|nr:hypothetical protein SeKB_A1034 [Salmonella enterica subsp. enterica serovar Kentucky str. CDC 191]
MEIIWRRGAPTLNNLTLSGVTTDHKIINLHFNKHDFRKID